MCTFHSKNLCWNILALLLRMVSSLGIRAKDTYRHISISTYINGHIQKHPFATYQGNPIGSLSRAWAGMRSGAKRGSFLSQRCFCVCVLCVCYLFLSQRLFFVFVYFVFVTWNPFFCLGLHEGQPETKKGRSVGLKMIICFCLSYLSCLHVTLICFQTCCEKVVL